MTKICTVCGDSKPRTAFPKNGKDRKGNVRYRTDCKECYNITRKLTRNKSVTKFLDNTKRRTGEEGTYTLVDWRDAMLHFRGCCAYCRKQQRRGRDHRLTRDHVIPVSKGGPTSRENIVPGCRSCNSRKGNRDMREWFVTQRFYKKEQLQLLERWVMQHD